jgi:hypothetical protein
VREIEEIEVCPGVGDNLQDTNELQGSGELLWKLDGRSVISRVFPFGTDDRFDCLIGWSLELGGARENRFETDLKVTGSSDVPRASSRPPLTPIDRFAPVPHLHHHGHILLAPACSDRFALVPHLHCGCTLLVPASRSCSCSPSSSSASRPRPHHNDRQLTVCPGLVELPPGPGVQGCQGCFLCR